MFKRPQHKAFCVDCPAHMPTHHRSLEKQQHTLVTSEGRPQTLLFVVPRPGAITEAKQHVCARRNYKTTCKQFKPRYRLILIEVHFAYPIKSLNMDAKTSVKSAYFRKK